MAISYKGQIGPGDGPTHTDRTCECPLFMPIALCRRYRWERRRKRRRRRRRGRRR